MDSSMQSSPDPLNASQNSRPAPKSRRAPRVRSSLPLQGSSPSKQTFELDVGNQLSPQKIRVTVEAGNSDIEGAYVNYKGGEEISPTLTTVSRRRERTTTTTIPLKGLSDTEEEVTQSVATPKRGRGRPRKTGTPVPARKNGRSITPTQRTGRRKSVGELIDGDDEADVNFELGKSVEINRGKKGSRSRSRKGTKQAQSGTDEPSKPVPKKRGRRKSVAAEAEVPAGDSRFSNTDPHQVSDTAGPSRSQSTIESRLSISPVATIRSTASQGPVEPDLVIARFDPGNETPHRTGWSSPRVLEAAHPSEVRPRNGGNYPSPSLSPNKSSFGQSVEEAMPVSSHQAYEDNYDEEGEDGVGEMPEFDTILESEGFSMISVDSVPSLRKHISSPVENPSTSKQKPPIMKGLLAVQEAEASAYDDSFSAIPEEILAAASPTKPVQNPRLLSVQATRVDDSFSKVPSEVLEDATPARQKGFSRSLTKVNTTKLTLPTRALSLADYDDSFSVIPPEVLDAATPVASRKQHLELTILNLPHHRSDSSPSQAKSSRLLTPEESPPPPSVSSKGKSREASDQVSTLQAETNNVTANESSFMHSHLPSSPPVVAPRRYTYTAHLRQHRQFNPDVTQTPSIVFSSPSLPPPPVQVPKVNLDLAPVSEQIDRPALSPIARAGRMLQDIVVPSSPRFRSQSLGSPFKSPAADRRSSSIIAGDQPRIQVLVPERLGPLPQLDLSSQLSASSSRRQRSNLQHGDPFQTSGNRNKRSPSPEEQQKYALAAPGDRGYSDPRLSSLRSRPASVHSDNMSWQAEEEISVPLQSSLLATQGQSGQTAEERWSAERAEVIKQVKQADTDRLIVIDSDDEEPNHVDAEDDEGFGQLLETLNSSSPAGPTAQEVSRDIGEKPRRSKIPSPWRKNSKRLVYSDELTQLSSPVAEKVPAPKRSAKEAISQPVTVRRISDPDLSFEGDSMEFSAWQIPQKSNFDPRPRDSGGADLSALFAASPPKRLPVLPKPTQPLFIEKEACPNRTSSFEFPSQIIERTREQSSGFAPIPQKSGFNPRPRAGLSSPIKQAPFVSNLFTGKPGDAVFNTPPEPSSSSSGSRPLGASSPSRINTLPPCRTPSAQVSPLNSEQDSSIISTADKENEAINSRTLNWTKSLQMQPIKSAVHTPLLPPSRSPSKSCLRSPMKTPSGQGAGFENMSPSKAVAFVSSSPMPSSPLALSSTTWSKDHWKLLDSILQQWKPSSPSSDGSSRRRRNSTRVISKLLGKTVSSRGERLVLEQWHLEVVDEFRGQVDGWEEKAVAMRVFSLLVGEEKRALRAAAAQKVM